MSASPAESAVRLPWLAPGATALASLARSDCASLDRHLICDPGFALLWLRAGAAHPIDDNCRSAMLRLAIDNLNGVPAGWLDEATPAIRTVLTTARGSARAAERLAAEGDRPILAIVAGLLAPLGWLAIAAVDPSAVESCLNDPEFRHDPESTQQRLWGQSAAQIARRLGRQWGLPAWLMAAVGNLDLPSEWSSEVGGDAALTTIVHDALRLFARSGDPLGLARALPRGDPPLIQIDLSFESDIDCLINSFAAPYLRDLLGLALDRLGGNEQSVADQLIDENESLRQALRSAHASFTDRLKAQKLAGLAEFAAGAGHEINNPLAVISGQAQYLLIKETEPDRERALHTVIQQAQRIHQILTDLMQFARPTRPQKRTLDIRDAARTVATNLHESAALQRVRIELLTPDEPCLVEADPKHLQTALASLLRNAIEAAPEDGWARVTVERHGERLQVIVEDSGTGPTAAQQDHLFDPFYSGRLAGRGRGLGLPTAWRLAREQGGDVAYESKHDSPARFVLTLPRSAEQLQSAERKSA